MVAANGFDRMPRRDRTVEDSQRWGEQWLSYAVNDLLQVDATIAPTVQIYQMIPRKHARSLSHLTSVEGSPYD
jgi:hypothetical protein